MTKFAKGIFDEFGCFNIEDFVKGDNVIAISRKRLGTHGPVRTRGIVRSVKRRPASITLVDVNGEVKTVRLNDVIFLQAPEQGWLGK